MSIVARRELVFTPATRLQYVKVHDCDRWLLAIDGVTVAYVEPLAGYEAERLPDSAQFDGPRRSL